MAKSTTPKLLPYPMFDGDRLIAAQQRNLDAFASASQIVVDGVKALAQRHNEMLQASVDEFVASGQTALNGKPTDFQPGDQIAKAKSVYETAINNARELAEIAIKAQSEAVEVLTKCAMANFEDFKSLAKAA